MATIGIITTIIVCAVLTFAVVAVGFGLYALHRYIMMDK
jgi:hypothetical protein